MTELVYQKNMISDFLQTWLNDFIKFGNIFFILIYFMISIVYKSITFILIDLFLALT